MEGYRDIFNARGVSYVNAHLIAPYARDQERALLLDRLDLQAGLRVCDLPAGGGFVAEGLSDYHVRDDDIVCVEPAAAFAARISERFLVVRRDTDNTGLDAQSFDRVSSLAGLHHIKDRNPFFTEAARILSRGGRIAVADVAVGCNAAKFLNGPVDRYTQTGHDGLFFEHGEFSEKLTHAGFRAMEERHVEFEWRFQDEEVMGRFCHALFGMSKTDETSVSAMLRDYFPVTEDEHGVALPWSLIYASGKKA